MRPGSGFRVAVAVPLLGLAVLFAAPATAADEVNIDHVEVVDGTVSVLLAVDGLSTGTVPDLDSIEATVDGDQVDVTAATVEAGEIVRTTILALDASKSMRGDRFVAAKDAAKAFLAAAPPDVRVGLLTFSGEVQETIAPTTDHDALGAAIDAIALTGGTSVYDAVVQSVNLAGTDGSRSVLVLSDGRDQGRSLPIEDAITAATDNRVIVDVVALEQKPQHRALLAQISNASGGRVFEAADPAALEAVFTAQADALASQVLVRFPQPENTSEEASLEVSIAAGGTTFQDSAFVSLASVADAGPAVVGPGKALVGTKAMLLGAVALGVGLAGVLAVVLLGSRGTSASEQRLAAYFGDAPRGTAAGRGRRQDETSHPSVRDSAVAMAEKVVKGDFETRLNQKLAGAGSELTGAEWLLLHAGITLGAGVVGFILGGGPLMVVLLLAGALVPWLYLKVRHSKRLAAFNAQLAETLTLMAGGLQAGLSLPQAVDTVVREGNQPMAGELRRVLVEQRLGVDIEEALEGIATRMESQDFAWVVMAIRIQREVGGNLAELLNTVADTIREREYLRRQVKVLSAEGRISAWVLGALPIVMFLYMLFVRPDSVRPLYTEPAGLVLSAAAIILISLGFWVMSRLVRIEV